MRKSVVDLQYKLFALTCGVVFFFLFLGVAYAQKSGTAPPQILPAATEAPPEEIAAERDAAQPIPAPPPVGRAQRKGLPGSSEPPPEAVAESRAQQERIPPAPKRTNKQQLAEKIRKQPGGSERVDAAQKGQTPEKVKKRGEPTANLLHKISSFFIGEAHAQTEFGISDGGSSSSSNEDTSNQFTADPGDSTPPPEGPFSLELSPMVSSANGTHNGLYSNPHNAIFYGAMDNRSYPSNSYIRLLASRRPDIGFEVTNPYAYLRVSIPRNGWYIVNLNAYLYGAQMKTYHYSYGVQLIEDHERQYGWADYPTLQYLNAGTHTFYFVLPSGGLVSRITVDSYPQ